MRLQCIKKDTGETEITLHELILILWTVDTCEVEDEVSLGTEVDEFFSGVTKVVLEYFIYLYSFVPTSFAIFYIIELGTKIFPTKPFAPVTKIFMLYYLVRLTILFNSF